MRNIRFISHEYLQELLLLRTLPFLQHHVDVVEKGVEGGVERQHNDGHGNVHFAGNGHTSRRQQTQCGDGEPAGEIRDGNSNQTTRHFQLLGLPGRVCGCHAVGANGGEDNSLPRSDEQEENEVENDHDAESVAVSREVVSGDG